eukprot:COSAG05_NODE_520_length_9047_cov_2.500224_2_plen_56_part_00
MANVHVYTRAAAERDTAQERLQAQAEAGVDAEMERLRVKDCCAPMHACIRTHPHP